MLPTTNTFCPQNVLAFSLNVTCTWEPPLTRAAVSIATASIPATFTVALPLPSTVTSGPLQEPAAQSPRTTSQEVPAGSAVANPRTSVPPSLLITTTPAAPRLNAIWLLPSDHQLATAVPATALWKPTMFATARCRCSHCQPLPQLTAFTMPLVADGGPWSLSEKVKLDMMFGVP